MEKLVVLKDNMVFMEVPLTEDTLTIGRDARSTISLDGASISRQHARVVKTEVGHLIEDCDSTNGIRVNGKKRKRHLLHPGDKVRIGSYMLQVPMMLEADDEDANKQVSVEGEARRVLPKTATVRYFRGSRKGITQKIDRSLYTIGSPGETVAAIARRPQGYYLIHIGGENPPRINNLEIDEVGGVMLHEGDVLEIGENLLEISY